MIAFSRISLFFGGLLILLAAFPVVAQEPDLNKIVINRRPLLDLHYEVLNKVERKEVDLAAVFSVQASGVLNAEGKLEESKFKFTGEGDPGMVELTRTAFGRVSDSGFMQYFASLGAKELRFSLSQDGQDSFRERSNRCGEPQAGRNDKSITQPRFRKLI